MKGIKVKRGGLKFKLISVITVLILLPLAILGVTSFLKSSAIMEETLKSANMEAVEQVQQSILYYKNQYDNSALQMSKDSNIQQIKVNPNNIELMMKTFKAYSESHKEVEAIYLGTTDKKFYRYPEKKMADDYDPTARPWYKQAVEKNAVIWTEPYKAASSGKLVVSVGIPVYNTFNNDEFLGVVGIDISLEALSNNINDIKVGEKGYVVLLDNSLNVMTNKNQELIGKPFEQKDVEEAIKNNQEGYKEYDSQEETGLVRKIATYNKVKDLGWTIIATTYTDEITRETSKMLYNTLVIGMISLIAAMIISVMFASRITKPINSLLLSITKMKEGDFTARCNIKSKDEIGELGEGFNKMLDEVSNLIYKIQDISKNLGTSASSLASVAEETSASAQSVTNAVEEIAIGASQEALETEKVANLTLTLSEKLNNLQYNTNAMMDSTEDVININKDAVQVVEELIGNNKLNEASISNIEDAIVELNDRSKEISNIINTIASIAQQTNLLALNASIEAARAGEAGRGFAVVAEEIRKLADGSNNAAKEINSIIVDIQNQSNNTVSKMKEVKEMSEAQTLSVDKVNTSFEYIYKSTETIADSIKQLSESINMINEDKESIVESMQNISAITEQAAASSEEVTASMHEQISAIQNVSLTAEELTGTAEQLNAEMAKFQVTKS
ncbi:methyl-accepting chemotaxis protein [Clostridium sp. UBA4548]|uniref:methyl-accepting chemotaxis protein n=1 Tax=Clostridium sp. UBA4548 TaxID=1946361 RepID=UPI0025B7D3CE|nr:methyl-accepting chemotaxis protein [Clostridium sp. UBA4548]